MAEAKFKIGDRVKGFNGMIGMIKAVNTQFGRFVYAVTLETNKAEVTFWENQLKPELKKP